MKQTITLLLSGRKLLFSDEKSRSIKIVSDNDCFYVKLETEEALPLAVFARFKKDGNFYTDVLLDENLMCNIPMNMLDGGGFEIGFYSAGFATSSLLVKVVSSVVRKEGIEDAEAVPSQTEQLISLVNSAPFVESAFINENGELVLNMKSAAQYNVGRVTGEKGEKGDKGERGTKGDKGEKGEKGDAYNLTDEDRGEIAELSVSYIDNQLLELLGSEADE